MDLVLSIYHLNQVLNKLKLDKLLNLNCLYKKWLENFLEPFHIHKSIFYFNFSILLSSTSAASIKDVTTPFRNKDLF